MAVRAGVIYPAFSLLSRRFVFSCGCYGCLGVGASETDSSVEEKETENTPTWCRLVHGYMAVYL